MVIRACLDERLTPIIGQALFLEYEDWKERYKLLLDRTGDLLVERPRRRPDGAAADQRRLALDAVGELLRQRGLAAERPLAQQQIVALEKSDTGGPLRGSE